MAGCGLTPKGKHDRALARGKELSRKGDFTRAALEYRTAIQVMPKDPEAYYELAVAFSHLHALQQAVYSYQKALELNPHYKEANIGLAEIMASGIDPTILSQARDRMSEVVRTGTSSVEALDVLALAELKLGQTGDALEELHHALEIAPRSLRTSVLLAQAKMLQNDHHAAEEVLKQACEHDAASPDPRIVLAKFYLGEKRSSDAERELNRALTLKPNSAPALLTLAQVQLRDGRKDIAEKTLRRVSTSPDRTTAGAYGTFLFREGRRDEAIREFERLAHSDAKDRAARSRLVAAYWSVGRRQEAARILDAALRRNAKDVDALIQRAQVYVIAGNYKQAQEDANAVLHLKPDSAEAHTLLADAYKGMGNSLQERQELGEALRLQPAAAGTRARMAELLIQTNAAASALKVLDEAPSFQKNSLPILIERNWALLSSGDMAAARKGIDQGLSAAHLPQLLLQDGVWKLQNGRTEAGRAALEQALTADPQMVGALQAIYQSYSAQHRSKEGVQTVKIHAAKAPRSAPIQTFLGQVLLASGDNEAAQNAFAAALTADSGMRPARDGLLTLDVRQGKLSEAIASVNGVLASNSNDLWARVWLADLEELKGDHASALINYQQANAADPKNPRLLNNLAYLLVDYKKQPDAALEYAQKARELAPNDPNYADTVGWVYYQKGLYSLAVKNFEAAASNSAAHAVCSYHLAMAYAKLGQRDRGREVLSAALKRDPNLPEASAAKQLLTE